MVIWNENIRRLSALNQCDLLLVGGKAAALGEMMNAGLPVPDGFCLTTNAYRTFVTENCLGDILDHGSGEVIQNAFIAAPMPDQMKAQIKAALRDLNLRAVAVRSSSTAEDLQEASFAGQQDTFLNVRGADAVMDAVKACWASLWTDRVCEYRARAGFAREEVEMGVVVQAMVNADSAGVLFSANPVTGDRDQVVINAAWGLGESVVSGLVTPDTLTVSKDGGAVLDAKIARKTVMTSYTDTGVQEQGVPEALQHKPVLSDTQIAQLAALSGKVEAHTGFPVDLEWAFVGRRLYLLQARPITALPEPVDKVDTLGREWSRLTLIERYPDPLTPYTASAMEKVFFQSFDRVLKLMGGEFKVGDNIIGIFFGRPYLNVSLLNTSGIRTATTLKTDAEVKRNKPGLLNLVRVAGVVLRTHKEWYRLQAPLEVSARHENAKSWEDVDVATLLQAMDRQESALRPMLDNHANSIVAAELTLQLLNTLAEKWLGDANGDLAMTLLAGLEGNMTVKTNHDLWKLAVSVRDNPEICTYLRNRQWSDWRKHIATFDGGVDFLSNLDLFLKIYGHRSPKYEFRHPCWVEEPTQILDMIRMYLGESIQDPAAGESLQSKARKQAEAEAQKALPWAKRVVFNWVLSLAQTYSRLRENQQFYLMMMLPTQQRVLRSLGTHLARAGWFETADDIYFLPQEDSVKLARQLLESPEGDPKDKLDVLERIKHNRQDLERFRRMDAPLGLGGKPVATQKGTHLSGVAGSKGIAQGPVRIVHDIEDFGELQPGDILVTPATTPAWTPLFGVAAGLVTDYGGLLSHSGVVAREYGLPAVLGVGNATQMLKTGEMVEIDGTNGTIRKV